MKNSRPPKCVHFSKGLKLNLADFLQIYCQNNACLAFPSLFPLDFHRVCTSAKKYLHDRFFCARFFPFKKSTFLQLQLFLPTVLPQFGHVCTVSYEVGRQKGIQAKQMLKCRRRRQREHKEDSCCMIFKVLCKFERCGNCSKLTRSAVPNNAEEERGEGGAVL